MLSPQDPIFLRYVEDNYIIPFSFSWNTSTAGDMTFYKAIDNHLMLLTNGQVIPKKTFGGYSVLVYLHKKVTQRTFTHRTHYYNTLMNVPMMQGLEEIAKFPEGTLTKYISWYSTGSGTDFDLILNFWGYYIPYEIIPKEILKYELLKILKTSYAI